MQIYDMCFCACLCLLDNKHDSLELFTFFYPFWSGLWIKLAHIGDLFWEYV